MTTLIIEDEKIAAERLQLMLQRNATPVDVLGVLDTVESSVSWLSTNTLPDFVLLDIHLADGSAFEIFRKVNVSVPVIFTTAYDQYSLEAFKLLSVDYLLKPVSADALHGAIMKLQRLRQPSAQAGIFQQLQGLIEQSKQKYKTRFVGRVGQKLFFIDVEEIAYFFCENKLVQMYTIDGNHFTVEHTMEALEKLLNPADFFRVSRSTIVRAKAIEQVKPYINSRLKIMMKLGTKPFEVIVSRERVPDFKTWANN
jgi:DNA-binding LytR/AlgR family response regulator